MSTLHAWTRHVCEELDIQLDDPDEMTRLVLDLTRDVAHGVARPAAPVTAFLLGLALRGDGAPDAAAAAQRLRDAAARWSNDDGSHDA